MKKQNVNNKLAFNKAAVAELNENQLKIVVGGTGGYGIIAEYDDQSNIIGGCIPDFSKYIRLN